MLFRLLALGLLASSSTALSAAKRPGCPTTKGGQQLCGTTCTNIYTDPNNCGQCGNVCPTGDICSGGVCYVPRPTCTNQACSATNSFSVECGNQIMAQSTVTTKASNIQGCISQCEADGADCTATEFNHQTMTCSFYNFGNELVPTVANPNYDAAFRCASTTTGSG